jgi:hypothetical protein
LTVVSDGTDTDNGYFYVDTTNLTGTTSTAAGLEATETIAVTVTAAPTGRAVTDLNINSVINVAASGNDLPSTAFALGTTTVADDDEDIIVDHDDTSKSKNGSFGSTIATTNEQNRYWFAVNTDTAAAIGAGKYTIRIRLSNANAQVIDYSMTVKFVATIADAGAVLTLASAGSITTGTTIARTANTSLTATLYPCFFKKSVACSLKVVSGKLYQSCSNVIHSNSTPCPITRCKAA